MNTVLTPKIEGNVIWTARFPRNVGSQTLVMLKIAEYFTTEAIDQSTFDILFIFISMPMYE